MVQFYRAIAGRGRTHYAGHITIIDGPLYQPIHQDAETAPDLGKRPEHNVITTGINRTQDRHNSCS